MKRKIIFGKSWGMAFRTYLPHHAKKDGSIAIHIIKTILNHLYNTPLAGDIMIRITGSHKMRRKLSADGRIDVL